MHSNQFSIFQIVINSQSCHSSRSFECYLPVNTSNREVCINAALDQAVERGLHLKNGQLFHVDFLNKVNVFLGVYPLSREIKISIQSIINNSIQINFMANSSSAGQMINQPLQQCYENNGPKTKKVKERTIQQAIRAVKLWRSYYDTADNQTGRRLYTLDEAAKKVGIAKKTLDDYYNHLRIAQQFDFNIQRYCQAKVGILRKFVKVAKEGGSDAISKQMPQYLVDTCIEKYWTTFNEL